MITYPKTKIDKRWDNMSIKLRKALYSPTYGETIIHIAQNQHLDEYKTEILMKLISFVLYGFIHTDELDKKITQETDIDNNIAKEIAEEIDQKIFSQFREELNQIYFPATEIDTNITNIKQKGERKEKGDKKIGNITISHNEKKKENDKDFIKSEFDKRSKEKTKEEKPFIIHQDNKQKNIEGDKKDFSFSFGDFFNKEKRKKPSAKIKTPEERKKTIHYSEFQTPAFQKNDQSFINVSNPTPPKKEKERKREENPPTGGEKKEKENNPSVSGNTIDLSNLN